MATERPTECAVCLRPAIGYHYGIASCKGCKTFFRRMCVSKEETECDLRNKCFDSTEKTPINIRCKACRFEKCVQLGMRVSALQLKKGELVILKSSKQSDHSPLKKPSIKSLSSKQTASNNIVQSLSYLENKLEALRLSVYNPDYYKMGSLTEVLLSESKLSMADKFGLSPGWPLSREQINPGKISTSLKIRDVPENACVKSLNRKFWKLFNTFTTLEYIKTFDFFHQLEIGDKLVLAGNVTLACMHFHASYFAVSRKIDRCYQPDGSESPQIDEATYPMTVMSHAPIIRCDVQRTEYLLLKAILLCNPTIHGLSEHAQIVLTRERKKYAEILFDHCLKTNNNGPNRFVELLGMFSVLKQQQQCVKSFFILHFAPVTDTFNKTAVFSHEIMFS